MSGGARAGDESGGAPGRRRGGVAVGAARHARPPTRPASATPVASAAVQLFVDRLLVLASPQFVLDVTSAPSVARLVVALDGPTPRDRAGRIVVALRAPRGRDDRAVRPVRGTATRRTTHTRQRTLWATVDWSYELLDDRRAAHARARRRVRRRLHRQPRRVRLRCRRSGGEHRGDDPSSRRSIARRRRPRRGRCTSLPAAVLGPRIRARHASRGRRPDAGTVAGVGRRRCRDRWPGRRRRRRARRTAGSRRRTSERDRRPHPRPRCGRRRDRRPDHVVDGAVLGARVVCAPRVWRGSSAALALVPADDDRDRRSVPARGRAPHRHGRVRAAPHAGRGRAGRGRPHGAISSPARRSPSWGTSSSRPSIVDPLEPTSRPRSYSTAANDEAGVALVLLRLMLCRQGQLDEHSGDELQRLLDEAMDLYRRLGNRRGQLWCLAELGFRRLECGEIDLRRNTSGVAWCSRWSSATSTVRPGCATRSGRPGEPRAPLADAAAQFEAADAIQHRLGDELNRGGRSAGSSGRTSAPVSWPTPCAGWMSSASFLTGDMVPLYRYGLPRSVPARWRSSPGCGDCAGLILGALDLLEPPPSLSPMDVADRERCRGGRGRGAGPVGLAEARRRVHGVSAAQLARQVCASVGAPPDRRVAAPAEPSRRAQRRPRRRATARPRPSRRMVDVVRSSGAPRPAMEMLSLGRPFMVQDDGWRRRPLCCRRGR